MSTTGRAREGRAAVWEAGAEVASARGTEGWSASWADGASAAAPTTDAAVWSSRREAELEAG